MTTFVTLIVLAALAGGAYWFISTRAKRTILPPPVAPTPTPTVNDGAKEK